MQISAYEEVEMRLSELSQYKKITIQCHDNPDPDALASGWGLMKYFNSVGCETRFLYSGRFQITKSNLILMESELGINVTYAPEYTCDEDELLITVDCQYGQGNVSTAKADNVAVIDHHHGNPNVKYAEVRPSLGSCSTLVWKMMKDEGYDLSADKELTTAFYYGLMTDTGNFSEVHHPLDRDMQDSVYFSKDNITRFCNSNISLEEMVIAGKALIHYIYMGKCACGIIEVEPCDPNILGFISDLALQVDKFNYCIAYNEVSGGYKLSVRSCSKDVRANEFAAFITEGIGSGGGHSGKAGGFIGRNQFEKKYPGVDFPDFIKKRVDEYFTLSMIIDAAEYELDTTEMKHYVKTEMKLGYIDPLEFLDIGDQISVRTLEGDVELTVSDDFYIMVGLKGEVYPIKKTKFNASYRVSPEPYDLKTEYYPTLHISGTGDIIELYEHTKTCYSTGGSEVLARPIDRIMKIYTAWDKESYMLGNPGDYLVCRTDDVHDMYIVAHDIFLLTYQEK